MRVPRRPAERILSSQTTEENDINPRSKAAHEISITSSSSIEALHFENTTTTEGISHKNVDSVSAALDPDLEAALDSNADFYDELNNPREMSTRKLQEVVDASGNLASSSSRKALFALLASCYVRHGIVAALAIAGLHSLLKDTDFFAKDLSSLPPIGAITMLDLTIEVICDRFDLSTHDEHIQLLHFLRLIIKHSGGCISPLSLQRMYRTINFICSCYSTKTDWIAEGMAMPCNDPGMDITPFKVLKQLIWDTVAQVEQVEIAYFLPEVDFWDDTIVIPKNFSESYLEVRIIVEDMIDDVIDSVDTSRLCESVYQTISKQSFTASSITFWSQVNAFSRRLFLESVYRNAFVILCAICKQSWHQIRTTPKSAEPLPRDLGSKLVALEAIYEYCNSAGEKLRTSKVMGYQIRRLVIPCLLFNVSYGLVDHKIFSKLLRIITALWKKWRKHIRIEFAILCEQLIFKVLQATVIQIRPIYQMMVIQEVVNWFDQPHMLIEMFVNYDMDRKFVSHWNTFSYLVRSMCAIGRRLSIVTNAWDYRPGGSQPEESNKVVITIRDVHLQALEEVSRMAKTLMDASGHAYLILQDSEFIKKSYNQDWAEDEDTIMRKTATTPATFSISLENDGQTPNSEKLAVSPMAANMAGSVRSRRQAHQESEHLIAEATKIYREKSLKRAIEYLLSNDFMPNTPQEIANFLRVYKNNFDASAIGDYLGEGGTNPVEEDYWSQIRFRYTRAVSFVEMDIEPALRLYLTGCGFRLPGEAQKINRFVEVFVKAFWQDNSGTQFCPFSHPDTIHLLSYAIIMLNTDLHRANLDNSTKFTGTKKNKRKMTKEEFVNNLRGPCFYSPVYNRLYTHFFIGSFLNRCGSRSRY